MRAFKDKIVVITGAASGIGRATSLRFAERGSKVILIDLNANGLNSLIREIEDKGSEGFFLKVDVTDLEALKEGAKEIVNLYGKIDIWINNAGIAVYGEFQQIPPHEFKRVMDVNFFGQINGVYAAMPYLEKSESMGVMLATISILGEATAPLQTPYASSKFALTGFYGSLHEELIHRKSRMKVGTILPSSVATPFFSHAKTYLGVEPRPFPPAFSAELIAEKFEKAALNPELGIVGGSIGSSYIKLYRYLTKLFHPVQAQLGYLFQRSHYSKEPEGVNNLEAEIKEGGQLMDNRFMYIPYTVSKAFKPLLILTGAGLITKLLSTPKGQR